MDQDLRISKIAYVLFWFCMVALAALPGCESNDPIKIGFVAGTTGRVADLGISGRDAAQLLIDQINLDGGIKGRPIRLIIKNDQQDPERARQVVKELIDEKVAAMIGPMTSDMGVAITPLLNEARVVTVSPTATTQSLSDLDDFFFRVSATTKEYATKSADYHIKTGDMNRIAAVYDLNNRSFCENWLQNFTTRFTAQNGKIAAAIGFDVNKGKNLLEVAREALSHQPDGVLIIANSMDSALICQQIRKLDQRIPITLADWGATERLLELGGKAVEGVTVIQTFDRASQVPAYQAFRNAYLKRFKREPGFPGVYTHDAVNVILAALRARKKGQNLKETILSIKHFDGLQGGFSFNQFGDVLRSNASISIVKNQTFVVLE